MAAQDVTRYIANPDVSCREEGPDGALLFDPDADEVLVVNITGLLIWQLISKPRSQEEIVDSLAEQCNNVPENQAAQDVSEFLEQLLAKGFASILEGEEI